LPNPAAAAWMDRGYKDMNWHLDPKSAFGNVPVLVLVGTDDGQTPAQVRELYRQYTQLSPDGRDIEIDDAGHDVICRMTKDIARRVRASGAVYTFVSDILTLRKK